MNQEIVIVAAKRTPIGSFAGSLSTLRAPELGAAVIKELLAETKLAPEQISEVIMGNVLTTGVGQTPPARPRCWPACLWKPPQPPSTWCAVPA